MRNKHQKNCEICGNKFHFKDLFPIALVRSTVLDLALKQHPNINKEGFICIPDLRTINDLRFEEILKEGKGALTHLEQEVLESLQKQELLSENVNEEFDEGLTFGDRLADKIAKFGGSWTFISLFGFVLLVWMGINSIQFLEGPFDPYPYILLNLVLSTLAAIQAPIIMMSQNRQSAKDRLSFEQNYQTNLKSELQIRQLNARLELFMKHQWQKMHEMGCVQEEILQEFVSKSLREK